MVEMLTKPKMSQNGVSIFEKVRVDTSNNPK